MTISNPTNYRDRVEYIIRMYKVINGEAYPSTMIKNTTIAELCRYDGGPYRRIKGWCEKKVVEIEEETKPKQVIDTPDMVEAGKVFHKCFDLMKSRNEKYGDSWKVLTTPSLANLCEMKLHRIANLPEGAPKTEDELMDTINYCVFGLMKLKNKEK